MAARPAPDPPAGEPTAVAGEPAPGADGRSPAPRWVSEPRARQRVTRPLLNRETVIDAALRLLDREGGESLTMRAVARELGVSAGSLYGHVANKEELVQLLLDRVFGELAPVEPGPDWGGRVKAFMRDARRLLRRHPGVAPLTLGRVPAGPRFLEHVEAILALLRGAGLPDRVAGFAADLAGLYIGAHVYEESLAAVAPPLGDGGVERRREWIARLPADRFPNVTAVMDPLFEGSGDERFEWRIDLLVRGLATYATEPTWAQPGPPPSGPGRDPMMNR